MGTPFYTGNSDLVAQQLQLERQQRLADALQQQGQQPAAPDSWNSMPVVPRVGWGGALAKMAQQLGGSAMQAGINKNQAALYGQQFKYATQLMQDPANNPNGIAPETAARMAIQNPDQWNALNQRVQTPTESVLNSIQMGGTADQRQAAEVARLRAAAMAQTPTGSHTDPDNPAGPLAFTATPPANTNPTMTPNGTVTGVQTIPGALPAVAQNAQAAAFGGFQGSPQAAPAGPKGEQGIAMPETPDFMRSPVVQATGPATPNPPPSAPNPQQAGAVPGHRVVYGPTPGIPDQVGGMIQRHAALTSANSEASNTISYLQQIQSLAPKAATGQFSDKLTLLNSLLSYVPGVSERATDAVTATNLLNKYSNQIVARLGSTGSLSTDAARSILESANPNSHMNPAAIQEAAGNLIGAQHQIQAKKSLLDPVAATRDPIAYQKAETAFDQAADPRIFQWKSMPAGPARDAFKAKIMAQDPTLGAKAQALQGLGVQ